MNLTINQKKRLKALPEIAKIRNEAAERLIALRKAKKVKPYDYIEEFNDYKKIEEQLIDKRLWRI